MLPAPEQDRIGKEQDRFARVLEVYRSGSFRLAA